MKRVLALILAVTMLATLAGMLTGCLGGVNTKTPSTQKPAQNNQNPVVTAPQNDNNSPDPVTDPPTEPPVVAVPLAEVPVLSDKDYLDDDDVKDAYGNKYEGPYFELSAFGTAGEITEFNSYTRHAEVEFKTDGQYQYLTGTIFANPEQKENDDVELFVYADDELVYYSGLIRRKDKARDIAIEIGNCDILTIESRSFDSRGNDEPAVILVNAIVTNDFDGTLTEGEDFNTNLYSLTNCHIYSSNSDIEGGTLEDSFGTVHKGLYLDLMCYGEGFTSAHDAKIEYAVNGEYLYLSGTYFANSYQDEHEVVEMFIYADDKLVYESGKVTRADRPVEFCIEIENCDIIRFEATSEGNGTGYTKPRIYIMNPMVSNEEP